MSLPDPGPVHPQAFSVLPPLSADSSSLGKFVEADADAKADLKEYPSLSTTSAEALDDGGKLTWTNFSADFKRRKGERVPHYLGRLATEGNTIPDAFLTCAASQIGQIMLSCPNALYRAGLVSGTILMISTMLLAIWTMFILSCLYLERKKVKLANGTWKDHTQHVTQYHEVVGFHLGRPMQILVQILIALALFGTAVAQIIACASDLYYIMPQFSKRDLALVWGAVLMCFTFLPTFRHLRIINIVALVGTTLTACYVMDEARKHGFSQAHLAKLWPTWDAKHTQPPAQRFFTGGATLINALGGHSIVYEMMDAMKQPSRYINMYFFGQAWTIFLVVPHSILTVVSWPVEIGSNDNLYGLLPITTIKKASVWLMCLHQLAAFAYYATPLLFFWEKIIGTHAAKWYIRLPSRVPIGLIIYACGVAFPFYGAINSLMSAVNSPFTAFAIPAFTFNYIYRNKALRESAVMKPPRWMRPNNNYWALYIVNAIIFCVYLGFGVTATAYSVKTIVQNSQTFGVFAKCYQCPKVHGLVLLPPPVAATNLTSLASL